VLERANGSWLRALADASVGRRLLAERFDTHPGRLVRPHDGTPTRWFGRRWIPQCAAGIR
jgi:hypothetical protein